MGLNPVLSEIVFWIASLAAIVFALLMVTRRNPLYSALFLIFMFGAVSLEFLLLHAPFLAFMQVLVYGGAIMVLYLFVIMLINPREDDLPEEGGPADRMFALGMSGFLWVLLVIGIGKSELVASGGSFASLPAPPPSVIPAPDGGSREVGHGTVEAFGQELFVNHLLVFELTSIMILIAIFGAVHLSIRARKQKAAKGPKKVNVIPEHARRRSAERRGKAAANV